MPYTYHTDEDRREMLEFLGFSSESELFQSIPEELRLKTELPFARGMSEPEVLRRFASLAAKNNAAAGLVSFLGGGIYDHVVPSVVKNIASRPEFVTAYTPYQPEVSQGTLQVIFEFQTHISRLTNLPVANASMYDAASGVAEAAMMAAKIGRRSVVLYPESINPRYLRVLRRYLAGQSIELRALAASGAGDIEPETVRAALTDEVAGVIVQTPNYFGTLERPWEYVEDVHAAGALLIACVDPMSLALFRPPGDYQADIVVGEGQSLGNEMSFGGPLVGFMACQEKLIRSMPGRIVSATRDVDGKVGYILTLQTREQHIRREKATSNICTNQGLMMTRATVYLSLLGNEGLVELARVCYNGAHRLREKISACTGYSIKHDGPFFREFVVQCPVDASTVVAVARQSGVLAGVALEKYYGEKARNELLVAVTEKHTDDDFDKLCQVLAAARSGAKEVTNA